MEKECNNLQREAKAYLDAMRGTFSRTQRTACARCFDLTFPISAMTSSQSRIADTLDLFYTADRTSDVGGFDLVSGLERRG
jgi:amphiphysin